MNQSIEPHTDLKPSHDLHRYVLAMEYRLGIPAKDSILNIPDLEFTSPEVSSLSHRYYHFLLLHIENEKFYYGQIVNALNDPALTVQQRRHMHECLETYYKR